MVCLAQHEVTLFESSVLHTNVTCISKPTDTSEHNYTRYGIRVWDDRNPTFDWIIYRRYSEFRILRFNIENAIKQDEMCKNCKLLSKQTCFLHFPSRQLKFLNFNEKNLQIRKFGLNIFLESIAMAARLCREGMTCHTRRIMDQFLNINELRYTFLNMDVNEAIDYDRISMDEKYTQHQNLPSPLFVPSAPCHLDHVPHELSPQRHSMNSSFQNEENHEDNKINGLNGRFSDPGLESCNNTNYAQVLASSTLSFGGSVLHKTKRRTFSRQAHISSAKKYKKKMEAQFLKKLQEREKKKSRKLNIMESIPEEVNSEQLGEDEDKE